MTDQSQLSEFPSDWTRALCVVAHPDDIEFGSSGAIAAWIAAGKSVDYLLVTRGEAGIAGIAPEEAGPLREAEQRASAGVVGVKEVEFLEGYRDGCVEYGVGLRRDIAAAIRKHRPDLVLAYNNRDSTFSGRRNSPDHRHTGVAALDAVGDAGNRWVFPELGLEPWSGVKYTAMMASPNPTHAVDVTDAVDVSIASLEAHRSYLGGLGFTGSVREPVVGLYQAVAQRFGGRLAVPLELVPR